MPPPYAPQSGGTVAPTPQTVERPGTHEALGKHELLLLTTPTFLAPDCPVPGVPNEAVTFWKSGMRLTGPGVAGGLTLSRPGPAPSRCPLPARAAGASGGAATAASNRPHDGVCPPPRRSSPASPRHVSSRRRHRGYRWERAGSGHPALAEHTGHRSVISPGYLDNFSNRRSRGGTCFQDSL